MKISKPFRTASWVQKSVGILAAEYLRLVWKTNSFAIDPADFYERVAPDLPVIFAMWHGQHFMSPFGLREKKLRAKVLISRHRDGEINAIAAERLGVEIIRGSGSSGGDFRRKGGFAAFRAMVDALAQGYNIAITADVPKISRIAGRGVVQLAKISGRPIYPAAPASSRRIQMKNWDRSVVNLPFGRFAIAVGEPIRVAANADDTALEEARRLVEAQLNAATARAYAIVDGGAKSQALSAPAERSAAGEGAQTASRPPYFT